MSTLQKKIGIGFLLLFIFSTSFSQINPEDEKELAAIRTELEILSKKIEDAFNKNPKNLDVMQSRLKQINAITDTAKLRLAVEDYRTTYLSAYGAMVKTAGVDYNEFVKLMTEKYPSYTFSIRNNYGISFKKKPTKGTSKSGTVPSTPTTTTTAITGFLQNTEASCSLGAGSSIIFPIKSVRASTTSVVAGGCSAQGLLSKNISFPATASSILLRATWKQKINGYAVGVVGFAMAHALAWSPLELDSYDCNDWATAPFLWVDNFSREMNFDVTTDFTESKGKTYTLYFDTRSRSIAAVCCATSSSAQINYSRVDLIVTK